MPPRPDAAVFMGIGPANFAGQGDAWARAVEKHLDGVAAESFATTGGGLSFAVDRPVDPAWYRRKDWLDEQERRVLDDYTHVVAEAVRPVFGLRYGDTLGADLPVLAEHGKPVAMLFHGSEIRNPRRHAEASQWSPFRDDDWDLVRVLQDQSERLGRVVSDFDGPKLVSTPDLLADVDGAVWLPVVVDPEAWPVGGTPLRGARPVVLHVPSNPRMKGSALVDPVVRALQDEGLIDYVRPEAVAPEDMPGLVASADIVLDQFALGSYGVSAAQAMVAGRVVIGHVRDDVRRLVPDHLPIVEADPSTLEEVLRSLLADRTEAQARAAAGREFALSWHDGRRSAGVLADFLGAGPRVPS